MAVPSRTLFMVRFYDPRSEGSPPEVVFGPFGEVCVGEWIMWARPPGETSAGERKVAGLEIARGPGGAVSPRWVVLIGDAKHVYGHFTIEPGRSWSPPTDPACQGGER